MGAETPGLRHSAPQRQVGTPDGGPPASRFAEGAIRVHNDSLGASATAANNAPPSTREAGCAEAKIERSVGPPIWQRSQWAKSLRKAPGFGPCSLTPERLA